MSEIYQVTIITQDEQQFTGKMSRREPAIVNGFVTLATEDGQWLYFTPSDVKRIVYVPDTKVEQPAAEEPASEETEVPEETQDAPAAETGEEQEEKAE
nr:hypothetical protein [Pseudescherichia vulneris]